jgi:MGT family glycosyltransferase
MEFAGCVAAERLGLPHAAVQVSAWRPRLHRLLSEPLDQLRASVDLPPDPELLTLYRYLLLVTSPPSFLDGDAALPPTAHALRPVAFDQSGDERLPDWVERLPLGRPTVYATMGTVVNRSPGVLEAMLTGLREEPITVIMTTGRDRDPAAFGSQPPNVHLERYIPQSLLFPHCDLVVTHGGTGTVIAALGHGLPMVFLPIAADQPDNARRCTELGAAQTIASDQRTPDAIRNAVRAVLTDPKYRENAKHLRDEIESMPGPEQAATLLEQLPLPSAVDR